MSIRDMTVASRAEGFRRYQAQPTRAEPTNVNHIDYRTECAGCSGDFLLPSPPSKKATTSQDQAGKARASDVFRRGGAQRGRDLVSAISCGSYLCLSLRPKPAQQVQRCLITPSLEHVTWRDPTVTPSRLAISPRLIPSATNSLIFSIACGVNLTARLPLTGWLAVVIVMAAPLEVAEAIRPSIGVTAAANQAPINEKRDFHFLDNFARPALFNVIGII